MHWPAWRIRLRILYGIVQTLSHDTGTLCEGAHRVYRKLMSNYPFESELAHLEQIIPFLMTAPPLGLPYWRRRILALSPPDGRLPAGSVERIGRLMDIFKEIERKASRNAASTATTTTTTR